MLVLLYFTYLYRSFRRFYSSSCFNPFIDNLCIYQKHHDYQDEIYLENKTGREKGEVW